MTLFREITLIYFEHYPNIVHAVCVNNAPAFNVKVCRRIKEPQNTEGLKSDLLLARIMMT